MSKTGYWNKDEFVTRKGMNFLHETLKRIEKELKNLDNNDFFVADIRMEIKNIREHYGIEK